MSGMRLFVKNFLYSLVGDRQPIQLRHTDGLEVSTSVFQSGDHKGKDMQDAVP
jgi:hypothetical protein